MKSKNYSKILHVAAKVCIAISLCIIILKGSNCFNTYPKLNSESKSLSWAFVILGLCLYILGEITKVRNTKK